MFKQQRQIKKSWKRLRTFFKWLFIAVILALLLLLLKDLMDNQNVLIQKVNEQSSTINHLQGQLQYLANVNHHMQNQIQLTQMQIDLEHTKVSEYINDRLTQQTPQVNVGKIPVVMSEQDVHNEIQPQLVSTTPIVIVGALTVLKSLLGMLIPAF